MPGSPCVTASHQVPLFGRQLAVTLAESPVVVGDVFIIDAKSSFIPARSLRIRLLLMLSPRFDKAPACSPRAPTLHNAP